MMTVAAFAHGGASGVVKQRMDAMSNMGKVMKTMAIMMRGESPLDADLIRASAHTILDHSGNSLTKLFPDHSNIKPSEARDEIWSNWEEFNNLADQLNTLATGMEAAAGNDLMMAGSGSMMKSGGMTSGGMMGKGGIMDGDAHMPTPQMLASMPIDGVFNMVAQTCSACHTKFRFEKK
ncbi:MAG: cytochrome C [Hyphomicrobiales bacterium]|nr:MAG: cytochrome C [Hyphomicrobiales bacterium]